MNSSVNAVFNAKIVKDVTLVTKSKTNGQKTLNSAQVATKSEIEKSTALFVSDSGRPERINV